ncbi:MAG TPA: hypothetical protein VGL92_12810, partial [Acidimicrobiia bacterium]
PESLAAGTAACATPVSAGPGLAVDGVATSDHDQVSGARPGAPGRGGGPIPVLPLTVPGVIAWHRKRVPQREPFREPLSRPSP